MDILNDMVKRAKKLNSTVVFPEGDEERTLEAAVRLAGDGVCRAVAVAPDKALIEKTAARKGLDISGIALQVPDRSLLDDNVVKAFVRHHVRKGMSEEDAYRFVLDPLSFSALYLSSRRADANVGGARADTADILRAALYGVGTKAGIKLISSFFLMLPPEGHPLARTPVLYADCAVNPDPGARGLRDIAAETVTSFKKLFPEEAARIAFLSFSTRGSADHPSLKKLREATELTRAHFAGDQKVFVDGELQFDAAAVPSVGQRKASGSPVAGKANIFIFPDLNSGNIGYKITERFGLFRAIGPVTQGLARPLSDLSRGCSADDIYYVAALTLLQGARDKV
ncbi:MAG: phosphotransacetylase [Endomicrobiales bacterium]